MKIPGGIITNIDSMVQMTNNSYSTAGSWNDAGKAASSHPAILYTAS